MLTKNEIIKAKHPGGNKDHFIWDEAIPGFGIRIYPSGKKAFVFGYRIQGKHKRITLGQFPSITLDHAKAKALECMAKLSNGIDPSKAGREEKPKSITCAELVSIYLERWAHKYKKTWKEDEYKLDLHFLQKFGSRTIDTITKSEIKKLHFELSETAPVQANRLISCLSKVFQCAHDWGFLPESHANPARGIAKNKEKKRDIWINADKFGELMEALNEEPLQAQAAIKLFLLTGLRHHELIRLKWSDIDFPKATLSIRDTKSGRPHTVPLTQVAMDILMSIKPVSGLSKVIEINPYVFPGRYPNTCWNEFPRKSWRRIRDKIGMPELTIHSLRHTVASWLASSGVSLRMISQILNQSTPSITERYAHLESDPIKAVLDAHSIAMFGGKND